MIVYRTTGPLVFFKGERTKESILDVASFDYIDLLGSNLFCYCYCLGQ